MKKFIAPLIAILSATAIGVTVNVPLNLQSFNAGELSPLMNARSDYAKYPAGAKTLQNMLVRSQGPITRRPGTKYIASVKDATDTIRIIPFEYSTTDAYIIELGDYYARFYRNGGQILDPNTSPYEINTPWDSNDVNEIQFAQDAQVMRLVHPDYEPQKLTRTAHTSWTCVDVNSITGPFLDENNDATWTLDPCDTTGDINIVSTDPLFDANHVGALWRLSHWLEANTSIHGYFRTEGNKTSSSTPTCQKWRRYSVTTGGTWRGGFTIQKSYDAGATWINVFYQYMQYGGNIQFTGQETEDDCILRIYIDNLALEYSSDELGWCYYTILLQEFLNNGIVEITSVSDPCNVNATVLYALGSTAATQYWSEGAWSTYRGFPRTVEYHEQRVLYGGSESYPQAIWSSIIADEDSDYDDFTANMGAADLSGNLGGPDDAAWTYQLPGMNPIQWLKSGEYLFVGTSSGVGKLGQQNKPITPNFPPIYRVQNHNGCAYIQPANAVDAILYVERGGQKVRELSYTYATEKYEAPDMTILAEHITGGGITQIAFQHRPDPILWSIREDGQLLSFTYNKAHDVLAWGEHDTDGDFRSVAKISGTNEDQLWSVVDRTINSANVKYIEQFQPLNWTLTSSPTDQNDCWFVDCGKQAITGLSHLAGETVSLFANGRPIASQYGTGDPFVVTAGAIDPNDPNLIEFTVGLPYTSIYESMPLVAKASSALQKTGVLQVRMDFQDTLACNLGTDSTHKSPIQFSTDSFATTIDAFTGLKVATFPRGVSRETTIYIDVNEPVPMTVRSINPTIQVIE